MICAKFTQGKRRLCLHRGFILNERKSLIDSRIEVKLCNIHSFKHSPLLKADLTTSIEQTVMWCVSLQIRKVTGLMCLPHLRQLNLSGNCIQSADNVAHLRVNIKLLGNKSCVLRLGFVKNVLKLCRP